MDDFGNDYQTQGWWETCEEYAHSMYTFGMFDEVCADICWQCWLDYVACDI